MFRLIKAAKPFAPYILISWMITIIIVSSTPNLPVLKIHTQKSDIRLDYFIHFCEYGLLAFLAFLSFSKKDLSMKTARILAVASGLILFAVADEYHQKMIPGRTFNPRDLLGNFAGIVVAMVVFVIIIRRLNQNR